MIEKEVVQGDTFPVVYKHMENGVLADLPEGYDLIIGLRRDNSKVVTTFSYQNGDFESQTETGVYRWKISHKLSMSLEGSVVVEMVLYSRDGSFVKHCTDPIKLKVIESFMNEHLDIGQ